MMSNVKKTRKIQPQRRRQQEKRKACQSGNIMGNASLALPVCTTVLRMQFRGDGLQKEKVSITTARKMLNNAYNLLTFAFFLYLCS